MQFGPHHWQADGDKGACSGLPLHSVAGPICSGLHSSAHLCLIAVADLKPYRRTSLLLQYCVCLHVAFHSPSPETPHYEAASKTAPSHVAREL